MICKVKASIEKYGMPLEGRTTVVGLSGGADSMALLSILNSIKDEYKTRLIACHVNHGIRGVAADSDERFVKEQCEKLKIELKVLKADVPRLAEENGMGLEECGRKVRYDFFNSIGEDVIIATAHTLSDKCETLILNETRGASLKGLCSIPAVRGNVVRPLIDCTRDEIEEFCKENRIAYITDETNFDETYARNRIRLKVIPELKKINPSFERAVLRLTQNAAADEDYLSSLAKKLTNQAFDSNSYSADLIAAEHIAVRQRMITEIIRRETGINPELVHIRMIDEILAGGTTEIIGDTVVKVENNRLKVNPDTDCFTEWERDFVLPETQTPSGKFKGKILNKNELPLTQNVHNKVLDFDGIIGVAVLRNRRAGDKMRLAGSSCTKTLKKLFNEKHLENRNDILIIADESGVAWAQGLGCADRCKITDKTKSILVIGEDKKDD